MEDDGYQHLYQYRTIKEQQEEEDRLMTDEDRKERDELFKRFFGPTPAERWKAVQELNQTPLNKLAQQALRQVKAAPEYIDPGELYLLQLIQWALAKKKVTLVGPKAGMEFLRNTLEVMGWQWNPEAVMRVFEESDEGEPVSLLEPGPLDPVRLAEEAIEQLHSRLSAAIRDYPIVTPLD